MSLYQILNEYYWFYSATIIFLCGFITLLAIDITATVDTYMGKIFSVFIELNEAAADLKYKADILKKEIDHFGKDKKKFMSMTSIEHMYTNQEDSTVKMPERIMKQQELDNVSGRIIGVLNENGFKCAEIK